MREKSPWLTGHTFHLIPVSPGTYMIPAATYLKHPLFQSRDRLDFLLTLPAPHDRARNQRSGLGHISQSLSLCRLLEPSRKAPFVPVALSLCYSGGSQSPRPQCTQSLVAILGLAPNLAKFIPLDFGTFTTIPFATNLPVSRRTIRGVRRAGFHAKLQRHSPRRSSVFHAINCACPTISM